jgi:endoglycosylceramidase
MEAAAKALAKKQGTDAPSFTDMMQILMQPDELRKHADDMDLYKAFVDGGLSYIEEFEGKVLASFYNRVTEAIRQVDHNHIVFIETNIMCNAGTPSGVVPIVDSNGNRDPLQAYAPHGYDIVIDTPEVAKSNPERVELIFQRHAEKSKQLGMPALIGEWGALAGQPGTLPAAQMSVRQIEKHLFSDTYWSYGSSREIDKAPYFPVLARPYPAAIAGTLIQYESILESGTLTCVWNEDPTIKANSRIYLPAQWFLKGYKITLEPEGEGWSFEPITSEGDNGYLMIPTTGNDVERRLVVQALTESSNDH